MKQLTINEIVFLWAAMFKYDHKLHGFKFEDKGIEADEAHNKVDKLKSKYGDLL